MHSGDQRENPRLQNLPHDTWGKYYDYVYMSTYGPGYEQFNNISLNAVKGLLNPVKAVIADFGAGTGRLSIPLAAAGHNVISVEQSLPMLNELRRKALALNVNIQTENCRIQDYRGEKADMALCVFTVLNYITEDAELINIFRNINKHLEDNGLFFFDTADTVFFQHSTLFDIKRPDFRRKVEIIHDHDNLYTYQEHCHGIFNGEPFAYDDAFLLRYLTYEEVNNMLTEAGFVRLNSNFPQFANTGSTYYLYQKR